MILTHLCLFQFLGGASPLTPLFEQGNLLVFVAIDPGRHFVAVDPGRHFEARSP